MNLSIAICLCHFFIYQGTNYKMCSNLKFFEALFKRFTMQIFILIVFFNENFQRAIELYTTIPFVEDVIFLTQCLFLTKITNFVPGMPFGQKISILF